MSRIIGIDLGTTNSGVSIVRQGVPEMLANGQERIIPSMVSYMPQGKTVEDKWLVGTPARNQYVLNPETTVRSNGTWARITRFHWQDVLFPHPRYRLLYFES